MKFLKLYIDLNNNVDGGNDFLMIIQKDKPDTGNQFLLKNASYTNCNCH